MRKRLKHFKSIGDLAQEVGMSDRELWAVITGDTTRDIEAAEKLSEVANISVMTLMHVQSSRMRPGFLVWLSAITGLGKTDIWHVFQGERGVDTAKATALANVTGIPVEDWKSGGAWMIKRKVASNAENKEGEACPAV